jgi:hypothetical protein
MFVFLLLKTLQNAKLIEANAKFIYASGEKGLKNMIYGRLLFNLLSIIRGEINQSRRIDSSQGDKESSEFASRLRVFMN